MLTRKKADQLIDEYESMSEEERDALEERAGAWLYLVMAVETWDYLGVECLVEGSIGMVHVFCSEEHAEAYRNKKTDPDLYQVIKVQRGGW